MRKALRVDAYRWEGRPDDLLPAYLARWEVATEADTIHAACGHAWHEHAITTDPRHQAVCPGQWVTKEPNGDVRVLSEHDFHAGYEPLPG